MRKFILLLAALVLAAPSFGAPVFGRYVGVMHHHGIKRDQLAKLELVASREEGNVIHLKGILTLHFGDFRSGEYVAYHFDSVQFNVLTQVFVFDQADQMVTLVGKQINGNEFQGDFRSTYTGDNGTLNLRNDQPAQPTQPLLEPVWGEYKGLCNSRVYGEDTPTTVQLYTYRSTQGNERNANPFMAYNIRGFIGERDPKGQPCGLERTMGSCVWGNIKAGQYNFYDRKLALFGDFRTMTCSTEADGLKCKGCSTLLKRTSTETSGVRAMNPAPMKDMFSVTKVTEADPVVKGEITSIQGEYNGYLHHEYLDQFQPASLNLLTYQASGEAGKAPTLRLSAMASLIFGSDHDVPEVLAYRFKERQYPNPLTLPQFTLALPEKDVDAILQITSMGNGVVKGTWYSQLFGRVGTFEMRKDGAVQLPSGAKLFEPINGAYQGTQWDLSLQVGLGRAEPNTENMFAPLTIEGFAQWPDLTPMRKLTNSSYDFYTGRIGLEQDEHAFIGQRLSRKRLLLKRTRLASQAPLPEHELQPYRLVGEGEGTLK